MVLSFLSAFRVWCVCDACDVYVSPGHFFLFFSTFYIRMAHASLALLSFYHNHLYHHRHHLFNFLLALAVIGEELCEWIRAACSTSTRWLLWVSRKVNINLFIQFFFGDHRWGVDAFVYIYFITSFKYDDKEARYVGLSCRCHLSNSQMVSPV